MRARARRLTQMLTRRMIVVQLVILTACVGLILIPIIVLPTISGTRNIHPADPSVIIAISQSIGFDTDRALRLEPTRSLREMAAQYPNLWFLAETFDGQEVTFGDVPSEASPLRPLLGDLISLQVLMDRGGETINLVVRSLEYPGGPVKIAFSGGPRLGLSELIPVITVGIMLGIFCFLALASFIAIPRLVNREMRGLDAAAGAAGTINIDQRGIRIPESGLPLEVLTLVHAVNAALERLDDSHSRRERFLADAAHELRTPIAVLSARIETAPPFEGQDRLLADVVRLSDLTTQLLDMQWLNLTDPILGNIDLVALGTGIVVDLAPLAVAAGYDLELDAPATPVLVKGEAVGIERAVTNLVRNAIAYAGNRGVIRVKVSGQGTISVSDDGPGIPPSERRRIFEPFHRVKPSREGAGLGLTLVEAIVKRHGASITVGTSTTGGAVFEIRFPPHAGNVEATSAR